MPLVLLGDDRLYTNCHHFFGHPEWLDELPAVDPEGRELLRYHCYWEGVLTEQHLLSIRSLIVTQSPPFEVWLWLRPGDMAGNEVEVRRLSSAGVRVRAYEPEEMAGGTVLAGRQDLLCGRSPVFASDVFRTLVLWKHGGIYFDLDVLFLRDLRPLTGSEFVYQWSNTGCANSAVAHLRAASKSGAALLRRGVELGTFYPRQLYRLVDLVALLEDVDDLYLLPSFVFDPVWIAHDTGTRINDYCNSFEDFFEGESVVTMDDFFSGSYAYHWHNRWGRPLKAGAIAGQLHREILSRLAESQRDH